VKPLVRQHHLILEPASRLGPDLRQLGLFGSRRRLVAVLVERGFGLVVIPDPIHSAAQHPLLELVERALGMGFGIGLVALVASARWFLITHRPPRRVL
jgi:hypothetical protein